jgi:hypothetical protein
VLIHLVSRASDAKWVIKELRILTSPSWTAASNTVTL